MFSQYPDTALRWQLTFHVSNPETPRYSSEKRRCGEWILPLVQQSILRQRATHLNAALLLVVGIVQSLVVIEPLRKC